MDPIVIRIQADVRAAVQSIAELRQKYGEFAKTWLDTVKIAGKATVDFAGDKLIARANAYARVVEQIGGVSKLTQQEQARLNTLLTEAAAKYQALGEKAPRSFAKLIEATRLASKNPIITDKAIKEAERYAEAIKKIGGSVNLTAAEQVKATKTVNEAVEKYKQMGLAVPQAVSKIQRELKALADQKLFGDASIQKANQFVAAIQAAGGVSRLTGAEMAKVNKVLTEAAEKYRMLGQQVPAALQKILISTTKVAQTPIFGEGTIKKAEQAVAQIMRAGGVNKLTAQEQQKVNKLLTEAIEKYTALGRIVPKELQAIATATSKISRNQQLLGPLAGDAAINKAKEYVRAVSAIGGVTKLTVREQERFNKVLGEAIEKLVRMGKQVPDSWRQLYKETQTGTSTTAKFFDQLFFKIAGGATVAQLVSNALTGAFRLIRDSVYAATAAIVDLIKTGSEVQNIKTAFEGLTAGLNILPQELINKTREATKGLVSDFAIMESANRAMLFGLKLSSQEFAEMTEAGIILGRAMNLGPEQSVQRLILALGRMSPRILDDLGIIVKLADANKAWADAHGKTVKSMSGSEKVLAFQIAAMEKIREAMMSVGEIQLTLQDRITQLTVKFENWRRELGLQLSQSSVLHNALIMISQAFGQAFGSQNADLIRVIVRLLEELSIVLVQSAAYAADFAAFWARALTRTAVDILGFWKLVTSFFDAQVNLMLGLTVMASKIPGLNMLPQFKDLAAVTGVLLAAQKKLKEFSGQLEPEVEAIAISAGTAATNFSKLADALNKTAETMRMARGSRIVPPTARPAGGFEIEAPVEDTEAYDKAVDSLQKRIAKLNIQLKGAFENGVNNVEIMRRHGAAIRNVVTEAQELGIKLPAAINKGFKIVSEFDIAKIIKEHAKDISKEGEQLGRTMLQDLVRDTRFAGQQMMDNLNIMAKNYEEAMEAEVKTDRNALSRKIALIKIEATKRRAAINQNSSYAKEAAQAVADFEASEIRRVTQEYNDAVAEQALSRETWMNTLGDIFEEIPQLLQDAFTGGGGMAGAFKAIGSMMGEQLGKQLFTQTPLAQTLTAGIGKLFGKDFAAQFAGMLGPLGSMVGQFAVEGVSRLVKWLHQTDQEKIMKDVGRDWGVAISEGLANKIKKTLEELGRDDRQAATLLHIAEIMEEAGGVNTANVDIWAARVRDLFVLFDEGRISAQQLASSLDDAFEALIEHGIDRVTGLAKASLVELVRLAQVTGVEIESITKFITEQTEKILEGFNAIAVGITADWLHPEELDKSKKSLSELNDEAKELGKKIADLEGKQFLSGNQRVALRDYRKELAKIQEDIAKRKAEIAGTVDAMGEASGFTQKEFDRYSRLALVAFDAAIASGMNILKVIEEMGPGLDELTLASETLGFKQSEAFADLSAIRAWVKEHEKAAAAIGGLNDMAVGLANTNKMSQESFTDLAATAVDLFDKMTSEGLTSNQAMKALQPSLQILWELQKRNNFVLDERTAALVAQAEAEGKVGKQFMSNESRIADASERTAKALEAIAKKMGIDIPDAMDDVKDGGDDVKTSLDGVEQGLVDQMPVWDAWANNAMNRLQSVQRDVDTLNFGRSPGGLKEIPLQLVTSTKAVEEFARIGSKELEGLYDDLEDLRIDIPFMPHENRGPFKPRPPGEDIPRRLPGDECCGGIIIMPGAICIDTWTIEETQKIETVVTEAVLRGITRNEGGAYTTAQNLVRSMMHGY